jgi:hypothetical protein
MGIEKLSYTVEEYRRAESSLGFFFNEKPDVGVRESQPMDRFYASCRTDGRTGRAQASPVQGFRPNSP